MDTANKNYSANKSINKVKDIILEEVSEDAKHLHKLSLSYSNDKTQIYNKWADNYDDYVKNEQYMGPKNLVECLRKYLGNLTDDLTGNTAILDFGCGTGLVGSEIARQFRDINYSIIGVDISPGMINQSRKLNIYDNLVCADIVDKNKSLTNIRELVGDQFNLIVSCGVFLEGHVSLESIPRVFLHLLHKRGGVLAVTIRDSFLKRSPNFISDLKELKVLGFDILELSEIEYLKGVKAWLLVVKRG